MIFKTKISTAHMIICLFLFMTTALFLALKTKKFFYVQYLLHEQLLKMFAVNKYNSSISYLLTSQKNLARANNSKMIPNSLTEAGWFGRAWNIDSLRTKYLIPKTVTEDNYSIIILTNKPLSQLDSVINHYCHFRKASLILVISNKLEKRANPQAFRKVAHNGTVPAIFIQSVNNRLTNRFLPRHTVKTQCVLHLDDDLLADERIVEQDFLLWKTKSHLIVGKYGRLMNTDKNGLFYYDIYADKYNLILTGFAFLHVHYHDVFQQLPIRVLTFINKYMNCEDIAMNFVVSSLCNCTGCLISQVPGQHRQSFPTNLYDMKEELIQIQRQDHRPLSKRPNHYVVRSECCRLFSKLLNITNLQPREF